MPMRMPLVVLSLLLVTLAAGAQEGAEMMMPTPPPEMAKLDAMVGTWKGTGTFYAMGDPLKFEAVIKSGKRYMGQYLVEEETITAAMPGMEAPMVVHEELRVYWFDTAAKTYRTTSYDEMGTPMHGQCRFDGNKFISDYASSPFDPTRKFRIIGTMSGTDSVAVVGEDSGDGWKTTTKIFDCSYKRSSGM